MNDAPEQPEHSARVDAWLGQLTTSPQTVAEAFEALFDGLWARAHHTLGDVTLSAIVDRVLYVATEQFPCFAALQLDATGLRWEAFRQEAAATPVEELRRGVRFVLIEFLTVLGNLTAEVLTPPLHAEIDRAAAANALAGGPKEPSPASSPRVNGEDPKP